MAGEHRTIVDRGSIVSADGSLAGTEFVARCMKSCGWVGHEQSSWVLAEREGEDHETYIAMVES